MIPDPADAIRAPQLRCPDALLEEILFCVTSWPRGHGSQQWRRCVPGPCPSRCRGCIAAILVSGVYFGLPVTAVVSIETPSSRPLAAIAEELRAIPYIQNCFSMTGDFDLLLTVRARSSDHLGRILEEIRSYAPGRSRTLVVLATHFEGRVPPV